MINIFEKDLKIPFLLDVYGVLLTDRKREMMDYYYNEDYSLAEISEVTGISRQGVRDSIKKTVSELHDLENKLHMAERLQLLESSIGRASAELKQITEKLQDQALRDDVSNVLAILAETEEPQFPVAE